MICTEAYKEHIEYTFNAFCRIAIRYAAKKIEIYYSFVGKVELPD